MSKEYKAGDRAFTRVGRNLVEVRVKGKTDGGWTVETRSGKTLTVRNLEPRPGEAASAPAKAADTKPAKATAAKPAKAAEAKPAKAASKTPKSAAPSAKAATSKGLSLLGAAAAVLEQSDEPMSVKAMIETAKDRGLWAPGSGKTPEQTLYSAIIREIKSKGGESRFRKQDRGRFALAR